MGGIGISPSPESPLDKGNTLGYMELPPLRPEGAKALKLNFRMWFKNGLKAQKLLAQGIALGIMAISKAPCKGKSFVYCPVF